MEKVDFLYLSNFAIVGYGHFPTRNGLKSRKLSTFTSLRINNSSQFHRKNFAVLVWQIIWYQSCDCLFWESFSPLCIPFLSHLGISCNFHEMLHCAIAAGVRFFFIVLSWLSRSLTKIVYKMACYLILGKLSSSITFLLMK